MFVATTPSQLLVRVVLGVIVLLIGSAGSTQESRCANCHFANPTAPATEHADDWQRSPHGRNLVGCESCHGGDATTFESFQAHRGILASRNPASPVHRWNLPKTCGACHPGPFVAFQNSKHFELLRAGDAEPPTCTTCHGDVAAHLLSPRSLERECSTCHGNDGVAPNSDYAPQGRILLEEVSEVRELLKRAAELVGRVEDDERRERVEYELEQAEVPLIDAVQSGHAFVFEQVEERLAVARERTEALLNALANPELQ